MPGPAILINVGFRTTLGTVYVRLSMYGAKQNAHSLASSKVSALTPFFE